MEASWCWRRLAPRRSALIAKFAPPVQKKHILDAKTRELISLAVAVTTRSDGCIATHTKAAIDLGATREEVAEALSVAIAMNTGAAVGYSARVMEAFAVLSSKENQE